MFGKKVVTDYLMVCSGYQYKRQNNALNVELTFERARLILHHKGEKKADYLMQVSYAELIINANPIRWTVDPKEVGDWLERDRNTWE